jgi:hypothetical protein
VKGNISALETKINAVQEEQRQEIGAFQERIKAGQAEFEESVTCTVDTVGERVVYGRAADA